MQRQPLTIALRKLLMQKTFSHTSEKACFSDSKVEKLSLTDKF